MEKPKRLGRGLSALISDIRPVQISNIGGGQGTIDGPKLVAISVEMIVPSPFQPRRVFEPAALQRLSESIRQSGVMQPIVVRPRGAHFELIAGERRLRAAKLAGLTTIPAVVRDATDAEAAEGGLVENLQREDLNPIERAQAFRALCDRFNLTHGEVAARVGVDRSSVANFIRLLELEPPILDLLASGTLGLGHGKALLSCPAGASRESLAGAAAIGGWSVRRLEKAASAASAGRTEAASTETMRAAEIVELERQLGDHLGTKVSVQADRAGARGKLIIEFYGIDHFDGLMNRIGFVMK